MKKWLYNARVLIDNDTVIYRDVYQDINNINDKVTIIKYYIIYNGDIVEITRHNLVDAKPIFDKNIKGGCGK